MTTAAAPPDPRAVGPGARAQPARRRREPAPHAHRARSGPRASSARTPASARPRSGLLGSVPLLAFAGVSPFVQLLSRRWGPDRTVFVATAVMLAATVVRSLPGPDRLPSGPAPSPSAPASRSATCSCPALVKRDFPREVPLMTGAYTATLSLSAALASGLALPIAERGGWRLGIGVWGARRRAGPGRVAAPPASPRARRARPGRRVAARRPAAARPGAGPMWRSPLAWQVTPFMGTQAIFFYLLVTWLPSIEVSRGVEPRAARAGTSSSSRPPASSAACWSRFGHARPARPPPGRRRGERRAWRSRCSGLLLLPGARPGLARGRRAEQRGLAGRGPVLGRRAQPDDRRRRPALRAWCRASATCSAIIGPIGAGALFEATGGVGRRRWSASSW